MLLLDDWHKANETIQKAFLPFEQQQFSSPCSVFDCEFDSSDARLVGCIVKFFDNDHGTSFTGRIIDLRADRVTLNWEHCVHFSQ